MRKTALLASIAAMTLGTAAYGVTFTNGTGGAIPDHTGTPNPSAPATTFNQTLTVPAGTGTILTFDSVSLTMGTGLGANGAHTWVGDLVITLTSPSGDSVHVFSRPAATTSTSFGDGSTFASGGVYTFDTAGPSFTAAALVAATAAAVPAGTYGRFTTAGAGIPAPDPDTYASFSGDDSAGNWTLNIADFGNGDTGGIASWSINFSVVPEPTSLGLLAAGALLPLARRRR